MRYLSTHPCGYPWLVVRAKDNEREPWLDRARLFRSDDRLLAEAPKRRRRRSMPVLPVDARPALDDGRSYEYDLDSLDFYCDLRWLCLFIY